MKINTTQQEVLLITETGFSSRQCCGKNENGKEDQLTGREQLQEACWNGLVQEILPELFKENESKKDLYLWKLTEGRSFLELDLGVSPMEKDIHFSIDPYCFLAAQSWS